MKKNKLLVSFYLFASSLVINGMSSQDEACSRSAFIPRLFSQNSMLELSLNNYDVLGYYPDQIYEIEPWISLQATAFYFKSLKKEELAEYFLPACGQCTLVGQNNTSNISSPWIKIARPLNSPFASKLCIKPSRKASGVAIKFFVDASSWFMFNHECCWYKNWWASLFMPIVHVHHSMNAYEIPQSDLGTAPGGFATVIGALNNPSWRYGKLSCCVDGKTGIDDINIKLGLDVIKRAHSHLGVYAIGFVPTGGGTKARCLFEPLVGGNHAGFGGGINSDTQLLVTPISSFTCMFDVRYAYFFKHHEVRSFDLINGDWSRYLLVVTADALNDLLPGINYLTHSAEVIPGGNVDCWLAFDYQRHDWNFELGIDFWWRQKEKVSLDPLNLTVGVFDIDHCPRVTASSAKISQAIPNQPNAPVADAVFTPIANSAINQSSAAAPQATSVTLYGAVAYHVMVVCEKPLMLGLGGSYEMGDGKNALSQFGIWFKSDIGF